LWERVCAASGSASRAPLAAFQLQAEILTRTSAGTNEAKIDYRYLAPDCIRFMLPSRGTTGRFGPAQEQYWLQSSDGVVVLAGREYKEDRKTVDDMLALARNYVALSHPARLDLRALELAPAPADLPQGLAKRARKLSWLAFESPDFALVRGDVQRGDVKPAAPPLYRVELGVRGEDHLLAFAVVRALGRSEAEPLLVEFSKYQQQDDFELPFVLLVHALDHAQSPPAFAEKAAQEVYVISASLRPTFTLADFKPKK
ncbi:MAG: hypothetical protein HOP15_18055, partial [Planctomycetes bacterium]|nr:hypothetical protein [Planctomycetota bacterium]